MVRDFRPLAIATAGFTAFVNLYSPQALLPELSHEFGVGPSDISALMTASTAAIALTAPFTGALADVLGRKRLIAAAAFAVVVPTLIMYFAWTCRSSWSCASSRGCCCRQFSRSRSPMWATNGLRQKSRASPQCSSPAVASWVLRTFRHRGDCRSRRLARLVRRGRGDDIGRSHSRDLALPRERRFVHSDGFAASAKQMVAHLRNPRLLAIYAVGFGVLFNFVAAFTYVGFHLAAAPYFFTPTMLGALFATYLAGSFTVPWVGRAIVLFGRRRLVLGVIAIWIVGALLLLVPPVPRSSPG